MEDTATPPFMPYDERDEESGQFTPEFTDQEFLDVVADGDLLTTNDVAEEVGCKYRTAYERLNRLEDEGQIRSKKVGNSLVWMRDD